MKNVEVRHLENGLAVVILPLPWLKLVSFELSIPGGLVCDQEGFVGASLLFNELSASASEQKDSHQLALAFDRMGVQHSEEAEFDRHVYRATSKPDYLRESLSLVREMVCEPRFSETQLENGKKALVLELESLADDFERLVSEEMGAICYPAPYNRSTLGTRIGLQNSHLALMKSLWRERFCPKGSLLVLGGPVETEASFDLLEQVFGKWEGEGVVLPEFIVRPNFKRSSLKAASEQLHALITLPAPRFDDSLYYTGKVLSELLGGGMHGRLFTEVRERLGLCYSISCRHSASQHAGNFTVSLSCDSRHWNEARQQIIGILHYAASASQHELKRAKRNLLAALTFQIESAVAQVSRASVDWLLAKRVRSYAEIETGINSVTLSSLAEYLETYPSKNCYEVVLDREGGQKA